jgi:hypothetical protein
VPLVQPIEPVVDSPERRVPVLFMFRCITRTRRREALTTGSMGGTARACGSQDRGLPRPLYQAREAVPSDRVVGRVVQRVSGLAAVGVPYDGGGCVRACCASEASAYGTKLVCRHARTGPATRKPLSVFP